MTPPHMHISLSTFCSTGSFTTITLGGLVGIQGAAVAGTQGIGTSAPSAAAVAAATVGFARLEQTPNGMMFSSGTESVMLATGAPAKTWPVGKTINADGAAPKLHCRVAPAQTGSAISISGALTARK